MEGKQMKTFFRIIGFVAAFLFFAGGGESLVIKLLEVFA